MIIPQLTELYGLTIRSSVPLPGIPSLQTVADIELSFGEPRAVSPSVPEGELIAHAQWHEGFGYAHVRTGDGYLLRILKVAEFSTNADLSQIHCTVSPDYSNEVALIFFLGNVMTFVMAMRGECVLHASAVAVGGGVTAFVGPSGSGKTTVAAMLCNEGARLVTDDVLRVSIPLDGTAPMCFPGTGQLRLRETATILADPDTNKGKTADARTLLAPQSVTECLPLQRIVFPQPSRSQAVLSVSDVTAGDAVVRMLAAPRICGLPLSGQIFQQLSELARRVQTSSAVIPWGPPFPVGLLRALTT